jgi:hypothetical protein
LGNDHSRNRVPGEGNVLSEFPPDQFTISLFCESCDHQAILDREKVPDAMTVHELRKHLRCTACGSRNCSIRIIHTGAGGFR